MNLKNIKVKSSKEYPIIVDAKPCAKTVSILKNLIAGMHGELTGVLQYFFQSSVAHKIEKEVSNLLEEISIVEMEHLELLSHAIVCFGGEPRYETAQEQPFSASQVNYTTKLSKMLDVNIFAEESAIKNYKESIRHVDNESLKKLFERIIEDEEMHILAFRQLRDLVKFMTI